MYMRLFLYAQLQKMTALARGKNPAQPSEGRRKPSPSTHTPKSSEGGCVPKCGLTATRVRVPRACVQRSLGPTLHPLWIMPGPGNQHFDKLPSDALEVWEPLKSMRSLTLRFILCKVGAGVLGDSAALAERTFVSSETLYRYVAAVQLSCQVPSSYTAALLSSC